MPPAQTAHRVRRPASVAAVSASGAHRKLRIAIIASSRFPVAEPFAGGLETHVWTLTHALRRRGHTVTLFAAPGSDPTLGANLLSLRRLTLSPHARRDVSMPSDLVMAEHHAYLALMLELANNGSRRFDIVHNHSLHHLPVAMSSSLGVPMVSTLHTPPTPWLESAMQLCESGTIRFVGVSSHTARSWQSVAGDIPVIHNGVDCDLWPAGPGGNGLIWFGRVVREKGTHLAIEAAREAGRTLDIAGPVIDPDYFRDEVEPRLGEGIRYLGHLDQRALSHAVRHASAALVTPDWEEPYGLVVAEALASGTPVAAFARGGISEIVDETCARLLPGGDVDALARAIPVVEQLDRRAARRRAVEHCSVAAMVRRYEALFADVVGPAT